MFLCFFKESMSRYSQPQPGIHININQTTPSSTSFHLQADQRYHPAHCLSLLHHSSFHHDLTLPTSSLHHSYPLYKKKRNLSNLQPKPFNQEPPTASSKNPAQRNSTTDQPPTPTSQIPKPIRVKQQDHLTIHQQPTQRLPQTMPIDLGLKFKLGFAQPPLFFYI